MMKRRPYNSTNSMGMKIFFLIFKCLGGVASTLEAGGDGTGVN
jgi:hypothetical protein